MLIKKLHNNRQKIAAMVLAVFSIVFICDSLCDLGIINNSLTHQDNAHHSPKVVISEHEHDHNSHSHDHDVALSSTETPSDEDCCEEETSQFYASLIKYETPNFDLSQELVFHTVVWGNFSPISFTYKETNPHRLNSALSPPITGLYACILFQSFLC